MLFNSGAVMVPSYLQERNKITSSSRSHLINKCSLTQHEPDQIKSNHYCNSRKFAIFQQAKDIFIPSSKCIFLYKYSANVETRLIKQKVPWFQFDLILKFGNSSSNI